WKRRGASPPSSHFETNLTAHCEPERVYHTAQHHEECFGHLDGCAIEPDHAGALELAIWFHDAVYHSRRPDNEARSAALARRALGTLDPKIVDRVAELILVTKHDTPPRTPDEQLLVDIDLAILGADTERFDEYERQIREEYEWVPEPQYREARSAVLRGFLAREPLYSTEHFGRKLEERARGNIERSIARLGEG
ncbi:MAG: N-methyl-D-aspartate receptor NMDAR2C subunit, partial [Planctomycetota bacterium]